MNNAEGIWNEIEKILAAKYSSIAMNVWFSDCIPLNCSNSVFVLQAANTTKKMIIETRFKPDIVQCLEDLFACHYEVDILSPEEVPGYDFDEITADNESNDTLPEMAGYTFDKFIVGESNRIAHAASVAVANNPGSKTYNPLFIYGNSGLGKTHLLLAIGHAINDKDSNKRIVYIKGDEFTNEMVKSIREGSAEEFRIKYRNADLFLVDDIQFIAGKEQTQNEFFNTFNNIYEQNHQIVITSDRPPLEMTTLDDRLRTRFEGGLMVDIAPPDYETRMAIARTKAAQLGLVIPDDGIEYLAANIKSNVRQLEGVIKKITAYKEILNNEITLDWVKKATQDVIREGTYIPSPSKIINECARYFNITEEEVRGQSRAKNVSTARQFSMYLMRQLTNETLESIGREFENRNHATVLNSIKRIETQLKTDAKTVETIRNITSNINAQSQ